MKELLKNIFGKKTSYEPEVKLYEDVPFKNSTIKSMNSDDKSSKPNTVSMTKKDDEPKQIDELKERLDKVSTLAENMDLDSLKIITEELSDLLIGNNDGNVYATPSLSIISTLGAVLSEGYNKKNTDNELLCLIDKKEKDAQQMCKWSLAEYNDVERNRGMYRSIYFPYNETEEGLVFCTDQDTNPAWGNFYNEYKHIATKYGSRLSLNGGLEHNFGEMRKLLSSIKASFMTGCLHVCMECFKVEPTTDGPILFLRDFKGSISTLPVDFIDNDTASKMMLGKMLACELILHVADNLFEVSWIRVLRFTKDGLYSVIESDIVDYGCEFLDEPTEARDYIAEFGFRVSSIPDDNEVALMFKNRFYLNQLELDSCFFVY